MTLLHEIWKEGIRAFNSGKREVDVPAEYTERERQQWLDGWGFARYAQEGEPKKDA